MNAKNRKAVTEPAPRKSFFSALRADRHGLAFFAAILAFSLFSKLPRLSVPKDFYFDEVYHGYTATLYLHGDKEAYNPWAKAPEGKAVEWTHPPLSKLLMAGAMKVVGENAFGWRIGSVLFGTAAVALTGALAFELFGSVPVALLSMGLLSLETLAFVQSRLAMNDSYFIFFALLSFIFYIRWKRDPSRIGALYLTGTALGLALATKWTGLYVLLIFIVDQGAEVIWHGKVPKKSLIPHLPLAFGLLPALLYVASYGQFFWEGAGWSDFIKLQSEMWRYHSGLTATHDYSSVPWQWLLNLRPVWMHVDYSVPGRVGNIYNIGNSVILYAGLIAVYFALFKEKDRKWTWEKWFILLIYFALWLPWTFSPRVMLFYHYLPAVPALCILLARWLDQLFRDSEPAGPRLARGILAGAALWFVVFYPHLTEIPMPQGFVNSVYFALPGWK